jgi:hypothetical protein
VCNQHRGVSVNEQRFKDGKLAKTNINQLTMKKVKTGGTTNKGVVPFGKKKDHKHIAQLGNSIGMETIAIKTPVPCTTSNKTEDPFRITVIIFLSVVDNFYYLTTSSNMTHSNNFELPNILRMHLIWNMMASPS